MVVTLAFLKRRLLPTCRKTGDIFAKIQYFCPPALRHPHLRPMTTNALTAIETSVYRTPDEDIYKISKSPNSFVTMDTLKKRACAGRPFPD